VYAVGRRRSPLNGSYYFNKSPEKIRSPISSDTNNDIRALSASQLCQAVSVSRSFIYKEISAGKLKKTKIGRRTLFLKTDVMEWLKANKEVSYSADIIE